MLESNKAKYKLNYEGTETFEKDLETIEGLTEYPMYIPVNLHTEGAEVYKGIQRSFVRKDGSVYQDGRTWDGLAISIARADFEQRIKAMEGMADRWTADVSYPSVEEVYMARKEKTEDADEERLEPKTSVQIQEDSEAIESARAMGKANAEGQRVYEATMSAYKK